MLIINICNKRQNLRVEHGHGPLELGRGSQRSIQRIMLEDVYVSRDQLLIAELPDGCIQVNNLSQKRVVAVSDGSVLTPGGTLVVTLPASLTVGETQIGIEREVTEDFNKDTLQTVSDPPQRFAGRRGAIFVQIVRPGRIAATGKVGLLDGTAAILATIRRGPGRFSQTDRTRDRRNDWP